jgi:hypothetical protein
LILGPTGVHGSAKGPSWPFVIFGVVAILSGCVGITIVPHHYRYAPRVVASVTATPQRIVLELESDARNCVDRGEQKNGISKPLSKSKAHVREAGGIFAHELYQLRMRRFEFSDDLL